MFFCEYKKSINFFILLFLQFLRMNFRDIYLELLNTLNYHKLSYDSK